MERRYGMRMLDADLFSQPCSGITQSKPLTAVRWSGCN